MDAHEVVGWTNWAKGLIREEIERHSNIMDAAVGQALSERDALLRAEFKKELDALRAELVAKDNVVTELMRRRNAA